MYTNNQQQNNQVIDVWNQPQRAKIIRWTKVRTGHDGKPNRGIELESGINGEHKWLTVSSYNNVFRLSQWGSTISYQPHEDPDQRLFVTSEAQFHDNPMKVKAEQEFIANSQPTYSQQQGLEPPNQPSWGEQLQQQLDNSRPHGYQPDIPNQPPQQQTQPLNTIQADEGLLNNLAYVYQQCLYTSENICPDGYSPDDKRAIAISMAIQYFKIKGDMPF